MPLSRVSGVFLPYMDKSLSVRFDIPNFVFLCILQAAILALKSELGVRKRSSQKQELVEATVHVPVGAAKAEIENSISNPSINCSHVINFGSESGVTPRNGQVRESDIVMDIPAMANDRNWESVKAEPVTSGWDAIHEDDSRRNENFSKLSISDVFAC